MKTWFKVPDYLPKDCVSPHLTQGKWYVCGYVENGGGDFIADDDLQDHITFVGSAYTGGYSVEVKEFPEGFNPNEVDQAIFSQHLKDIPVKGCKPDNVNNPSHYGQGKIECIDYIKDFLNEEEYIGYLRGNIAKYLHRWRYKNGLEDLEKAKVYLGWLINAVGEPE